MLNENELTQRVLLSLCNSILPDAWSSNRSLHQFYLMRKADTQQDKNQDLSKTADETFCRVKIHLARHFLVHCPDGRGDKSKKNQYCVYAKVGQNKCLASGKILHLGQLSQWSSTVEANIALLAVCMSLRMSLRKSLHALLLNRFLFPLQCEKTQEMTSTTSMTISKDVAPKSKSTMQKMETSSSITRNYPCLNEQGRLTVIINFRLIYLNFALFTFHERIRYFHQH